MSRDTAQSIQTHWQWRLMGHVITHDSKTDKSMVFKLGGSTDHLTRQTWPLREVKWSKVKAQGHLTY